MTKEAVQTYRVSLDVEIRVSGGNDKGRRISAEEYVSTIIAYPLFEGAPPELSGIGWHGDDMRFDGQSHAPYQFHRGFHSINIKSIRKGGPITYEAQSDMWSSDC